MNKSTAANIARQARSSAAAQRRASKNAREHAACDHSGSRTPWKAGEYTGWTCDACGAEHADRKPVAS